MPSRPEKNSIDSERRYVARKISVGTGRSLAELAEEVDDIPAVVEYFSTAQSAGGTA